MKKEMYINNDLQINGLLLALTNKTNNNKLYFTKIPNYLSPFLILKPNEPVAEL